MKKLAFGLLIIFTGFGIQLKIKTSNTCAEINLNQLVKKAEACIEVGGQDHQCCYCPLIICYLGEGLWLEDHIESHG